MPSYVIHACEQGSDEWLKLRSGKITASNFSKALDTLKSGAMSKKAIDYAHQVAHERIAGYSLDDTFVTWQMKRGTELEWEARQEYEALTGELVSESGIVTDADGVFGYSSDGFIGEDGLAEIKTPSSATVISNLLLDNDYSEYMHQIQGGMWLTGRKWCDLMIYTPQLSSINKSLTVVRIERSDSFIDSMEIDLTNFYKMVQSIESRIRAL